MIGAILGLSSGDVHSLLYDADPAVTLDTGGGLITGTVEVEVPYDLHTIASGDFGVVLASLDLGPGEYLLFAGIADAGQPEEMTALAYIERDDGVGVTVASWQTWSASSAFLGGQLDPFDTLMMALVAVAPGATSEFELYAYGPSETNHLILDRITFEALKVG